MFSIFKNKKLFFIFIIKHFSFLFGKKINKTKQKLFLKTVVKTRLWIYCLQTT